MSFLSETLSRVKPSPTIAMTNLARELAAEGRDIISLSAGEPDFDTPAHIREAAKAAIDAGQTRYTAVDGIPQLKQAICDKFARDNGLDFTPAQITVGTGGKQVLYNALMATLNPGDEVIIPAPYWVSYPDMVALAGGTPVVIEAGIEAGYRISADRLEAAITPRTKWVILNSPSNPTGAGYGESHMRALTDVLMRHPHVWIMSDDMYEHLVFDDFRFVTPAQVEPGLRDRTLTVNGVSKAYAMTGWRLGYGIMSEEFAAHMARLQTNATSCTAAMTQMAGVEALTGPQDEADRMVAEFDKRRKVVVEGLNKLPGVSCVVPKGAFYAFPNIKRTGWKGKELATTLLNDTGVVTIGGPDFGVLGEGYLRLSYANSTENILKALDRMGQFLASRKAA